MPEVSDKMTKVLPVLQPSRFSIASVKEYLHHSAVIARANVMEGTNSIYGAIGRPPLFAPRMHEQWHQILDKSKSIIAGLPEAKQGKILFFPVWGTETAATTKAIEVILSHSLRLRGVDTHMVSCDRALPACLVDPLGNHHLGSPIEYPQHYSLASTCRHCVRSLDLLYENSLTPLIRMSEFCSKDDLNDAVQIVAQLSPESFSDFVYEDVGVGQHALASSFRVTGRGTLLDTPYHQWVLKHQLIGSIVVAKVTRAILKAHKPDRIALTHGIYVDHGTIAETARSMGVPLTVFVRPYRKDTVMLCHHDTYHRALLNESPSLWANRQLNEAEGSQLMEYVDSRRSGTMDSLTYHPNPIEGRDRIIEELELTKEKPIVSLFTNVLWDAQIYHACNAFPNMLEWVFETVDYYSKHPETQLVIRVHPAEVKSKRQSQQPVVDELKCRFPSLPSNIKVVPPENDISSYDLVEASQAALVFGTKMGLEIALRRIPVIVAGESFVRNKGITHDAASASEYFELLDRIPTMGKLSDEQFYRAQQYGYHFYFRRQIDFGFFKEGTSKEELRFTLKSLDELQLGQNSNLDKICQGLMTGSEFIVN